VSAFITSVSETIRKAPLALGTQKNTFCGTAVSTITEILWKTSSLHKISLKSGWWPKRLLIWRPSAILNFKKSFGYVTVIEFQICLCTKFHENLMIFRWDGDFTICNMAAILNSRTWPLSPCCSASQCKISLKSVADLWPKSIFFKLRPCIILNFKILTFGHVTVTEFQICMCIPNFIKIWRFSVAIWRFSRWRISAIFSNGFCEKPMQDFLCRSSVETIDLNGLVFEKVAFLYAFWRQTDKRTNRWTASMH